MPASERWRPSRWAIGAVALILLLPVPAHGLGVTDEPATDSVVTADSTPASTAPESTTVETSTPDRTVVGGSPGDDDATALTWVAIVAAVALLGVAMSWMVRRGDDRELERMDDDWPGGSEVI